MDTSARKQLLSTEMGVLVDAKEKMWVLSTKKGISVMWTKMVGDSDKSGW